MSCVSKIFERCLKKRITKFLDEHNILSPTQFGFRQKLSTSDAVVELLEGIYPALDSGEKTAAVFMDLSKSFDTVSHVRLLDILQQIGVKGKPLKLLESYLQNRIQQTKLRVPNTNIGGKCINSSEILSDVILCQPYSVPQGTVLSPVLYNVYVSGLSKLPLHGQLISFADDTALRVQGKTWDDVFYKIKQDMGKIKQWFAFHNLFLNMEKTKIVPFCMDRRNYPTEKNVRVHESGCSQVDENCTCGQIEITRTCKYLGVEIDANLRWEEHIVGMVKRLRSYCHIFRTLRTIVDLKLLKEFYYALVQSVIEYGICGYGRADSTILEQLKIAQNSVLKIMYKKDKMYPTKKLYQELSILPVKKIFHKNICATIHKHKEKYIKETDHPHQLRRKNIIVKTFKTKKGQKALEYIGIKYYNELPESLKNEKEEKIFKLKVRDWLKKNDLDTII